jgi:hypothetical protein
VGVRTQAKPTTAARESTGRAGLNQHVTRKEEEDEGSPWSTEDTPRPADYQPLPENPSPKPEPETEQQVDWSRSPARPPPPACESKGRAGQGQRKLVTDQRSARQANDNEWKEPLTVRIKQLKGMTMETIGSLTEEYPPVKPPPPARESTGRA